MEEGRHHQVAIGVAQADDLGPVPEDPQALAMGGGLNAFAAENKIVVLRRIQSGQQLAIPFRYGDVKAGEDLETNIVLQSGDVLVVR